MARNEEARMAKNTYTKPTGDCAVETDRDREVIVEQCVRERLTNCPYRFYFNRITWSFDKGGLTLNGCVPTFYMKQMLQTLLRDIKHVRRIFNEVDVASANGLSSERPKRPR